MKKLIPFILFFVSVSSFAQINVVHTDYGNIGDNLKIAIDTPASSSLNSTIRLSGANVIWNFSIGLLANEFDSMMYLLPASGAPAGANILVSTTTSKQYQYVDTNFVKVILDRPDKNISGLNLKILKFPFIYGAVLVDSMIYTKIGTPADFNSPKLSYIGYDSVKADIKAYDTTVCTGWGMLNLPDTSCNVLQIKYSVTSNTNLFGHMTSSGWTVINSLAGIAPHQKTVEYQWIGKNTKGYMARAVMDSTGMNVQNLIWRVKKLMIPIVKSISPATGKKGQTLNDTIYASNTHFKNAGSVAVYFNQGTSAIHVNLVSIINDSTLITNITITQNDSTGLYDISVTDPVYGNISFPASYRVNVSSVLPSIKSLSPGSAYSNIALNITIHGSATHFKVSSVPLVISFLDSGNLSSHIVVNSNAILDDSTVNCSVSIDSLAPIGKYDIQFTDYVDGQLNLSNAFSININNVGIADISTQPQLITLFPNPTSNEMSILLDKNYGKINAEIVDITRRVIKVFSFNCNKFSIDISDLNNGIYFCIISGKDFIATKKIIINK